MSASGLRIESSIDVIEGMLLRVEFSFFPDSAPLDLWCEVTRITTTGGFGTRFDKLDARTRSVIRSLLPKIGGGLLPRF